MRKLIAFTLALLLVASGTMAWAAPKYTTKQVMKEAMKGGLLKKVIGGDASDAEKQKLVEMFQAMAEEKPKVGSAESWKKLTSKLVKAAKSGDAATLKSASNCKACHNPHKPKN